MKKEKKKAAISIEMVILLVILIGSALAIFYFIFRADLGGTSEKEVCHTSVVTRASVGLLREVVPLNCKTDNLCLSRDGTCEKMTSPEIKKVKTEEEVYNFLAEQMADCWWMFGEGKMDYIGNAKATPTGFQSDLYCSICSQIAFDNSLYSLFAINPSAVSRANLGVPTTASNSLISREKFYDYLAKTNMSGKQTTYLNYFLGISDSKSISNVLKNNKTNFGYMDLEKWQIVTMAEFSRITFLQDISTGIWKGILLAITLPTAPDIAVDLIISVIPGKPFAGYLVGTIIQGESGHAYITPTIIEANSEDYSKLRCGDIKTLA